MRLALSDDQMDESLKTQVSREPLGSPWIECIRRIADDSTLERRLTSVRPGGAPPLACVDDDTAVEGLREHLKRQYVPSKQGLVIARRILATALSHAMRAYPDVHTYVRRASLAAVPVDLQPPTLLITGPDGSGKSALISALEKLFGDAPVFQASPHWEPKPIVGGIFLRVTARVRNAELFGMLAQRLGLYVKGNRAGPSLLQAIQTELYRQGCMFILVDETQTLANSDKGAAAHYINLTAALQKFGVPVIVVANDSTAHAISKQHSLDRQRLLGGACVMLPDDSADPTYIKHLTAYRDACPEALRFDPEADAVAIHLWTGGGSLALLVLVTLAYQRSRGADGSAHVDRAALSRAYASAEYSVFREEIELRRQRRLTGE